ncbi:MAG: hypothetical protein OXT65_08185 [Alphaproteobacteria bacterium]|nr:hypothetical protein [Alphaproteobacteria bacterium]
MPNEYLLLAVIFGVFFLPIYLCMRILGRGLRMAFLVTSVVCACFGIILCANAYGYLHAAIGAILVFCIGFMGVCLVKGVKRE